MSYPDGVFVDISVLCHVNNGHNHRGLPSPSVLVSVHFTISTYFIRSFRYRYITVLHFSYSKFNKIFTVQHESI